MDGKDKKLNIISLTPKQKEEDPILEACFKINSSLANLYNTGIISYKDLIHYSILIYFYKDFNDHEIKRLLKIGLLNIKGNDRNILNEFK